MALSARLLTLRHSPVLRQLPPYLSALCLFVGIAWLMILPLDAYSRSTYISENAILPGQVHTYFEGSEHNIFRAYRQEVYHLSTRSDADRYEGLAQIMRENGLKVANQPYSFQVANHEMSGTNVYGIIQGPRADATEALVLTAAWRNIDNQINYSGVALALTLARYFKRWSVWSKDIIVLLPDDSIYGPTAWVTAYHSTSHLTSPRTNISSLHLKSGAIQAALALDYPAGPWGQRFAALDIGYDGINGALPNLDLLNTAIQISNNQMNLPCSLHNFPAHSDSYLDRLSTLGSGLLKQSLGHATGPHAAFTPYHIDAITLKTVGDDGWADEIVLGRATESIVRSLNNLLEKLHQSFFFYLLLSTQRFVSVGNYLPAAMIVAGGFTITALGLWGQSGKIGLDARHPSEQEVGKSGNEKEELIPIRSGEDTAFIPAAAAQTTPRELFLPALCVLSIHALGCIPLYILTHTSAAHFLITFYLLTLLSHTLPIALLRALHPTPQHLLLIRTFSLLILGAALSTLSTLNFSLALALGVACSPLNFLSAIPTFTDLKLNRRAGLRGAGSMGSWLCCSPMALLILWSFHTGTSLETVLLEAAKGWQAQGVWTMGVVCGVWWPGWVVGGMTVLDEVVLK